jgi:hypothetical protein
MAALLAEFRVSTLRAWPPAQLAYWTFFRAAAAAALTARLKGSSSQDLDRDAFLIGDERLINHPSFVIEQAYPMSRPLSPFCAPPPNLFARIKRQAPNAAEGSDEASGGGPGTAKGLVFS